MQQLSNVMSSIHLTLYRRPVPAGVTLNNPLVTVLPVQSKSLSDCHGAHTRRIQEHADEEQTQIIVFNVDKHGWARQGKADTDRNTGE